MFDHLFFNRLLMVIYVLAFALNLYTRHYTQAWYWASALSILGAVTYGLR
jgi:hypothetical protein